MLEVGCWILDTGNWMSEVGHCDCEQSEAGSTKQEVFNFFGSCPKDSFGGYWFLELVWRFLFF